MKTLASIFSFLLFFVSSACIGVALGIELWRSDILPSGSKVAAVIVCAACILAGIAVGWHSASATKTMTQPEILSLKFFFARLAYSLSRLVYWPSLRSVNVVLRRWRLVVAVALIVAILIAFGCLTVQPLYSATCRLILEPDL